MSIAACKAVQMKKNYTEIAFVLDRSGSMGGCQEAAIAGFNQFLSEQQEAEGLARLTLVLFDDEYLVPVQSLPVQEVVPLNWETFVPRGSTALLDAIGKTIDDLGARIAALPGGDRPAQVIVSILTDGEENASRHFTWRDLAQRIKHQTDTYKWTFLFLGANQDAIATAAQMNIGHQNAASFVADSAGAAVSSRTISRKVRGLRAVSAGYAKPEEVRDANASLSEIVSEEDGKERGE